MPLSDEIKQVAEDLGKQLGADAGVREYVRLVQQIEQDAEVTTLELRYKQLYEGLVEREQKGEVLDRSETDEYYQLKSQIRNHPLLIMRDQQWTLVNAIFAETAQRLTNALGIEYTTFAA